MNWPFEYDDASDAIIPASEMPASPATPLALLGPVQTDATPVTGDAELTALADNLEYTLTVGQAVERFVAAKRQPPSARSIQRYCVEGQLAAQKIRTVFGAEWLINESALTRLIEAEPIVTGDASVADAPAAATPATPTNEIAPIQMPDTIAAGDANVTLATPPTPPTGELRTIAEVLIENARLLAQVEGRDAIIEELKEDRIFLREEVREGRRSRDDVKNIAELMLDTLKTMAVGRLPMSNTPPQDPQPTTYTDPRGR